MNALANRRTVHAGVFVLAGSACLVPAPEPASTRVPAGDDLRPAGSQYTAEMLVDAPRWHGRFVGPCEGGVVIHLGKPGSGDLLLRVETSTREYTLPLPDVGPMNLRYGCDHDGDGKVPAAEVQTVSVLERTDREVDLPLPFPADAGLDLRVADALAATGQPPATQGASPLPPGSPAAPAAPADANGADGAAGQPGAPPQPGAGSDLTAPTPPPPQPGGDTPEALAAPPGPPPPTAGAPPTAPG